MHKNRYEYAGKKRLPVIPRKYERVLKNLHINSYSYLDVPMSDGSKQYCKYWNEYCFKKEMVELPVYEFRGGRYYFVEMHSEKVPTEKSVDAAMSLKPKVDAEVKRVRKKNTESFLKGELKGKAAACLETANYRMPFETGELGDLYIFCIPRNSKSISHLVVFDLTKIYDEMPELEIPYGVEERILGKENANVIEWLEVLDIDNIRILQYGE